MNIEFLHPADQLVMFMERVYGYGMTTTSGGNISILDDNGDIWITPGGVDKGTLTRKDIVCVKPDGTIVGAHKPSSEFPFHQEIYRKRPDIKAVLHAHPPALVSFSIVRKIPDTRIIPNVRTVCGEIGMAKYAVPGSRELGENIAKVFEKGFNTVILENHGVVTGNTDLFKAFKAFETLDFCARIEIEATKIGETVCLSDENIELSNRKLDVRMEDFTPERHTSSENEARREMCVLIKRAYDQMLFTSTQGTFSTKLADGSFLITPYNEDRKYICAEDMVLIKDGKKEKGKTPSRSVLLHMEIYKAHPEINSVIIAHSPNIMAFAITKEKLDSKTIPESYILLRDVPKLPFGSTFINPTETAKAFVSSAPVVIVENDCVIATGSSLLNAFDRLEVAEYSAKAVIASKTIGNIVAISKEEVDEINQAFKLK